MDVAGSNQGPPVEDLVCVVTGGCADQGSEAESLGRWELRLGEGMARPGDLYSFKHFLSISTFQELGLHRGTK